MSTDTLNKQHLDNKNLAGKLFENKRDEMIKENPDVCAGDVWHEVAAFLLTLAGKPDSRPFVIPQDIANKFIKGYGLDPFKNLKINNLKNDFLLLISKFHYDLPDSREKSLAFTRLQEASMWLESAINQHGLVDSQNTSSESCTCKCKQKGGVN